MRRQGFTLVETLVVLGIIIMLLGLLSPMLARTYRQAARARVAGDIQSIVTALESYKQDFGQYPRVVSPTTGATTLGRALIAPGPANGTGADGADGPGFRVTRFSGPDGVLGNGDDELPGKIYPPYLPPDRFAMNGTQILDRFKQPILYYCAVGKPNITLPNGYAAAATTNVRPLYNFFDNPTIGLPAIRLLLGDNNTNGCIDNGETPRHTGPYILWSAGPDELHGPQAGDAAPTTTLDAADMDRCDDITNFKS